jgi:hypothetical protein
MVVVDGITNDFVCSTLEESNPLLFESVLISTFIVVKGSLALCNLYSINDKNTIIMIKNKKIKTFILFSE